MDFSNVLLALGLTATAFFIYKLMEYEMKGHHTRPAWKFYLQKLYDEYKIKRKQKSDKVKAGFDLERFESEEPKSLQNDESSESQLIYGNDDQENSLLIKYKRRENLVAEVWLVLKLKSGLVYTFPEHPNTIIENTTPKVFEGSGLKLENLVPYQKWRITYTGMLRRGIAGDVIDGEEHLHFVRMNFIWTTASNPVYWPYDRSSRLLATSLTSENSRDWMKMVSGDNSIGFEQFGACQGEVKIYDRDFLPYSNGMLPKMENIELNLPGLRQRRWNLYKNNNLYRSGVLLGSFKDGCFFEVGAFSANSQFGNFVFPSGDCHPIDSTDFDLASFGEQQDKLPAEKIIQVEAGNRKFKIVVNFKTDLKLPLFGECSKAFIVPLEVTYNAIVGYGMAIFCYPENSRGIPTKIKKIFNNSHLPSPDKLLISFDEKEAKSVAVAGGKGSSIAILKDIQDSKDNNVPDYFVPQGFIVSVSAMDQHLKENPEIKDRLKELEDIAYEKVDGDIHEACKRVQTAFVSSKLNELLRESIAERIKFDTARFAVRSSGVTEDSEESSAAGQNETFLGLRNVEEVLDGVAKCWASLYSFQSVQYRKQHIQPVWSSMAVVVQEMAAAESAGVLFSRHPLNGDPSVTVLTANYGLGESVVSAKADPDTFFVKRSYKDEVELIGWKIGQKKVQIEMDDKSTVKETELNEDKRNVLCMSEEIVLKLAKLGVIMEKLFGSPRDIEFAVTKDKIIYLLQSRPISSLNNFTDHEIIHENDSAVMSVDSLLTRANIGEVLVGSTSVFAQSTTGRCLNDAISSAILKEKNCSALYLRCLPISQQQIFMRLSELHFANLTDKIGIMDRVGAMSIFGFDIYEKYPQIIEIMKHKNSFKKIGILAQLSIMFRAFYNIDKAMKEMSEICIRLKQQFSQENLDKSRSTSDILNLIERGIVELRESFKCHIFASNYSIVYQMIAFSILTNNSEKLTAQHQSDIASILGSISDVESANVPVMIKNIADLIGEKHEKFHEVDIKTAVKWLKENCASAYNLFNDFMERHGHRSINELDFSAKSWSMEPEKVIEMIKSNLSIGTALKSDSSTKKITSEEIVENFKTPLNSVQQFIMKKILPKCQNGVRLRELAKSKLVMSVNEIRRALILLSKTLVNEGLLPDKDLFFFLSIKEIKDIIASRDGKLIAKAIRRQKIFSKLNEFKFPELTFDIPRPIQFERNSNEPVAKGDVLVEGAPICGGVVTARACVCKSFADINKLQKGDILITYGICYKGFSCKCRSNNILVDISAATDIGWSPYFPILSGICTENGGLVSHGAVVAREYGLPSIVGATFATDIIQHGQKITLNADDGNISVAL